MGMEKEKKMEGLIPLFYRAIKRNRIRNQYSTLESESESVSVSVSKSKESNYDIADFYVNPPRSHIYPNSLPDTEIHRHRRRNSVGDFELSDRRNTSGGATPQQQQQLVRFRSQRILSCLTGH